MKLCYQFLIHLSDIDLCSQWCMSIHLCHTWQQFQHCTLHTNCSTKGPWNVHTCHADRLCGALPVCTIIVALAVGHKERFISLMGSPPTVTGVLPVVFISISSVFFLLILSPAPADVVSRRVVLSCIWLWLCDRCARSSVKSRSSSCVQSVHCIPLFLPAVSDLHDPVDDQEEEERWKEAPLPNSSLHLETFRQLTNVGSLAALVLKGAPDEGDYLLGDSKVSQ